MHVESKALSQVPFQVGLKEVVSSLEEVPSMVKLDALQILEFVLLNFRGESVVHGSCREDSSRANDDGNELVVLAHDGMEDGSAQGRHEVDRSEGLDDLMSHYALRAPWMIDACNCKP